MACADTVGVLLAAGAGRRFGGNKLEAMLGDAMLGEHAARTMAAMGLGGLIAVHNPAHRRLATALAQRGFTLVANDDPAAGLSHSLALATIAAAAGTARAMLVCLADMPFVASDHLSALMTAGEGEIVASSSGGARMPPVMLPHSVWPELLRLRGDAGARQLLARATLVDADPAQLADVDTVAALDEARDRLLQMRRIVTQSVANF